MHFLAMYRRFAVLLAASLYVQAAASDSLDFVAEHLLEVPMDLRYLAFPKSQQGIEDNGPSIQLGYARLSGRSMAAEVSMLAISKSIKVVSGTQFMAGAFFDRLTFSHNQQTDILRPTFGKPADLPDETPVDISDVNGSGYHAGLSLSWVRQTTRGSTYQFGMAIEQLVINQFKVSFRTSDLANNITGSVDYAGTYTMLTPFLMYEGKSRFWTPEWRSTFHAIATLPLPRVGFKGHLQGPNFDIDSDSDAIGNGTHIPDAYLGLGYSIEHVRTGLSLDMGATLYSYVLEPVGHKDIAPPVFITLSKRF